MACEAETCCWINNAAVVVLTGFTMIVKRKATGLLLNFGEIDCRTWGWVLDV